MLSIASIRTKTAILVLRVAPFVFILSIQSIFAQDIDLSQYARWNLNQGHLLVDEEDYIEALAAYRIAATVNAVDEIKANAHFVMADVLLHLDNPAAAIEEYLTVFNKYRHVDGDASKLPEMSLRNVARLYEQLKHYDNALSTYQLFLKTYPDSEFSVYTKRQITRIKEGRIK